MVQCGAMRRNAVCYGGMGGMDGRTNEKYKCQKQNVRCKRLI